LKPLGDEDISLPHIINAGLGRNCRITWRQVWRDEILKQLIDFKPDFIFISAGFDGHKKDIINGGE
jgi:acetoin utilization deacetylase AcuC-like enzyme